MDFLADVLGENAEVFLHDLSNLENSVVKVRNEYISGRRKGDPPTDSAMSSIKNTTPGTNYNCNYQGITKEEKHLKCSTYYIKNDKKNIVGILCINQDIDRYISARKYLDSFFMISTDEVPKQQVKTLGNPFLNSLNHL